MTAIAKLSQRALIRLTGPDWASFLKGLCTAHIDRISQEVAEGRFFNLHYGAFLRPQGKMYADVLLQAVAAEEIWLDVPLSARDELVAKLTLYRLRAKVTIELMDVPVYVAFGGPLPAGFQADPRAAIVCAEFAFSYEYKSATVDEDAWLNFRCSMGIADPGRDFEADALYAIDANLDLLGGIDFHKGCFIGQELTSRMKRRGQIKNRILPFRIENHLPAVNAELLNGEKRAGHVLNVADTFGLALMRLDRSAGTITDSQGTISVFVPQWMAPHIALEAPQS